MRWFIAAILLPAALAVPAAEEPDAVYAKFHRAAASGDLDEMVRYAPAAQRAEIAAMSAAQRDATVKMLAAVMPRAFVLRNKTVNPDGRSARLVVSGPGPALAGEKPETLYGIIHMAMEGGEWKVGESNWSNTAPPTLPSAPAPRTATAPPPGAAQKAAPPSRGGAALVGSTADPPERKLGTAKEPCVYKPVMTAEDMERCK